ncbi:Aldehyde/histidinol dehydrogenase, partial [Desarmillaria tabescens]
AQKAAVYLTPTTLELDGKCPVLNPNQSSADLDVVTKRILFGKCHNSGQTCVSPDYLVVPTQNDPSVLPRIIASFRRAYTSFFPSDSHPTLSRISSPAHLARLTSLLTRSKGRVVLGGHADPANLRMDVTLVGVDETDPLMSEEIFGPILPILEIRDWEEAVQLVDTVSGAPLVVYLFSEDAVVKEIVRNRTRSGSLVCGCTFLQMAVYELPYGGIGESGSGRSNKSAMEEFSYIRSQIDVPTSESMESHLEIFYLPYSEEATEAVKKTGLGVCLPRSSAEGGIIEKSMNGCLFGRVGCGASVICAAGVCLVLGIRILITIHNMSLQ